MPFQIQDPETDRLARRVAALKKVSLTKAVHLALQHELEREEAADSKVDLVIAFSRALRAPVDPKKALPVDKTFYDSVSGNE